MYHHLAGVVVWFLLSFPKHIDDSKTGVGAIGKWYILVFEFSFSKNTPLNRKFHQKRERRGIKQSKTNKTKQNKTKPRQ